MEFTWIPWIWILIDSHPGIVLVSSDFFSIGVSCGLSLSIETNPMIHFIHTLYSMIYMNDISLTCRFIPIFYFCTICSLIIISFIVCSRLMCNFIIIVQNGTFEKAFELIYIQSIILFIANWIQFSMTMAHKDHVKNYKIQFVRSYLKIIQLQMQSTKIRLTTILVLETVSIIP